MKILLVNISLDSKLGGGTAERTRRLALSLVDSGHTCMVFAMSGNSWANEFIAKSVGFYITPRLGRRFPIPVPNIRRIWMETKRSDVVHIMGYWNLLSVVMGVVARLTHTPYVLCPAGEFSSLEAPNFIKRAFHLLVGRRLIAGSSGFVAITRAEQALIANVANIAPSEVIVLPNAVGQPLLPDPLAELRLRVPARPYLLFMGRLAAVKGPDFLIQAYMDTSLAHNYDLVMAGPDFGMLESLKLKLQNSELAARVHFVGHLNEVERNYFYQNAILLIIPSRSEAMSLVALEAGMLGVPVLLTNTCGFDEVQEVGGGLVVPPSSDGIASGLRELLGNPSSLRESGARLRRYVSENYTWSTVTSRMIAWLKLR